MSTYIIDNANWVSDGITKHGSLLVDNNRISAIRDRFTYYNFMKMNVAPFVMTPVHVTCDLELPIKQEFSSMKDYFLKEFISKGCSVILTSFRVQYEFEFLQRLKERKTSLLNSPLDYTIGLSTSPNLITTTIIRLCKKHKVPLIWVDLDNIMELKNIPWGWIKGELYDYPITFVPFFSTQIDTKVKKKSLKMWQKTMIYEKIPHFPTEIQQKSPLSLEELKKIGIYPHKGNFLVGGELSYNLYLKAEGENVDGSSSFKYDCHVLKCTMNKGKCYFLNNTGFFYPGAGEELMIQIPKYFI